MHLGNTGKIELRSCSGSPETNDRTFMSTDLSTEVSAALLNRGNEAVTFVLVCQLDYRGKTMRTQNFTEALQTNGGAEGSRTPDLLIANETLYQLSYDPIPPAIRHL